MNHHPFLVEIRPTNPGQIQLSDNFNPLGQTDSSTNYKLRFISLFYCDLDTASPRRTMHQVDGQRFPLEIEFVFLRDVTREDLPRFQTTVEEEEYDDPDDNTNDAMYGLYDGNQIAVIVAVLGEVNSKYRSIIRRHENCQLINVLQKM